MGSSPSIIMEISVLLLVLHVSGTLGIFPVIPSVTPSSKIEELDFKLREQADIMDRQQHLLDQHSMQLDQCKSMNDRQETQLSVLKSVSEQFSSELSSLKSVLQQERNIVLSQEKHITKLNLEQTEQKNTVREQSVELSRQNLEIQHLKLERAALLSDMEKLVERSSVREHVKISDQQIQTKTIREKNQTSLDVDDIDTKVQTTSKSISSQIEKFSDNNMNAKIEDTFSRFNKTKSHSQRDDLSGPRSIGDVEKSSENRGQSLRSNSIREKTVTNGGLSSRSDDLGSLGVVVNQLSQKVNQMDADLVAVKHVTADLGSTFIHWGSSTCSSASQLVYSGVVGGSDHMESGGAANHLCLTLSPVFAKNNLHHYAYGHLSGAEYHTDDSHERKDAVCAMCRSSLATTVMIPGTNTCLPGWHQQYSGFLMSGNPTDKAASEFICVDSKMESRIGSEKLDWGKLLFYTSAVCGSLPCGPYVNSAIVTCVVCSK